jgi:hypothetical protein
MELPGSRIYYGVCVPLVAMVLIPVKKSIVVISVCVENCDDKGEGKMLEN